MSCSKLYNNAYALPAGAAKTPLIVMMESVNASVAAQIAAIAAPVEELKHKEPSAVVVSADYQTGLPKVMKTYTVLGLRVLECIEENRKTGFAIIMCPETKKALVVFGRRTFSNWCEYPVEGCGRWNEFRFKHACLTAFIDRVSKENYADVAFALITASTPADAQKATRKIENFDPKYWDPVSPKCMYDSLLLTCTNKEYFDTIVEVSDIIRKELGLDSLVEFVEAGPDKIWGTGAPIRDYVDSVINRKHANLLDAARAGFECKVQSTSDDGVVSVKNVVTGTNQLGAALTAIMHTVCGVGSYEEFVGLVKAEELVVTLAE